MVRGILVTSGGWNISDKPGGSNSTGTSGWIFTTGDIQETALSITPLTFRPLNSGVAQGHITIIPADYPTIDFYGEPMTAAPLAAGAVQTPAAAGWLLDYGSLGNGTVSLTAGSRDADGIVSSNGSVTLEAEAGGSAVFDHWTVNGAMETANPLTLTMTESKTVTAVFYRTVTVTTANDSGPGSFREALTNAAEGDIITFDNSLAGQTVTLTSGLPEITKDIIIEGEGIILSGAGNYQILRITGAVEAVIRRVHFKDGKHSGWSGGGGAVFNESGTLTLESCIFSGNQADRGGAIYNYYGQLTMRACTFYGNTTSSGEIYTWGMLTLTGNLFYGNASSSGSKVIIYNPGLGGTITSGGYNVSDVASGYYSGSGWIFDATDIQVTAQTVDGTSFKPLSTELATLQIVPTALADYPATDFYGNTRSAYVNGSNLTAAGAVAEPAAP
jgi:hypothetical protein